MEILGTKRFIRKGFELGTTLNQPNWSNDAAHFFLPQGSVCAGSVFQLRFGVTLFASLRSRNNRTLNDPVHPSNEK